MLLYEVRIIGPRDASRVLSEGFAWIDDGRTYDLKPKWKDDCLVLRCYASVDMLEFVRSMSRSYPDLSFRWFRESAESELDGVAIQGGRIVDVFHYEELVDNLDDSEPVVLDNDVLAAMKADALEYEHCPAMSHYWSNRGRLCLTLFRIFVRCVRCSPMGRRHGWPGSCGSIHRAWRRRNGRDAAVNEADGAARFGEREGIKVIQTTKPQ